MAFGEESFLELIEAWDGAAAVVHYDRATGTWIFIAIHDDRLGKAVGGCRMQVYARPEDGLRDALRLSRGMTYKWAALGLPFGGAKSVLAVPGELAEEERSGLLRRFGELLNTLDGAYGTGEDLGTTPADMAQIAAVSPHVVQAHGRLGGPRDPGPFTALGVFEGIRVALGRVTGRADLHGRTVLVQGVGDVGAPLARLVSNAGGSVVLSDIDPDRAFALAVEIGGSVVKPEAVYTTVCDVYSPCAVGATLNAETIAHLECKVVAGAANNQLETDEDALRLHEEGILYAPDYVINAGGALAFGLLSQGPRSAEELEARVKGIGETLQALFEEASLADESPVNAAARLVEEALAGRR